MNAYITVDLGYGDSGKGTIVDFLVNQLQSEWTVRFSGGSQCAHNVYVEDKHHTFAQFSSGSFNAFNKTYLSEDVIVNPLNMLYEAGSPSCPENILSRTYVSDKALITLPIHVIKNRFDSYQHGLKNSCGMGIWETIKNPIKFRVKDVLNGDYSKFESIYQSYLNSDDTFKNYVESRVNLNELLTQFKEFELWTKNVNIVDDSFITDVLQHSDNIIFENAQGVLIDDTYGLADDIYNTPTKVTTVNAYKILEKLTGVDITVIGITRTFSTRHGDGDFQENDNLSFLIEDDDNQTGEYQGKLRVGDLQIKDLQYSIDVVKSEMRKGDRFGLAVTHTDKLPMSVIKVDDDILISSSGKNRFNKTTYDFLG